MTPRTSFSSQILPLKLNDFGIHPGRAGSCSGGLTGIVDMYIHAAANGSLEARMLYGDLVESDGRSRRRSRFGGGDPRAGYGRSAGAAYAAIATCGDSCPDIATASGNAAITLYFTKP